MPIIDEILKLSKEQQLAIMNAIQDNFDDLPEEKELSKDQIDFIRERVEKVKTSGMPVYSWEEMKQKLSSERRK